MLANQPARVVTAPTKKYLVVQVREHAAASRIRERVRTWGFRRALSCVTRASLASRRAQPSRVNKVTVTTNTSNTTTTTTNNTNTNDNNTNNTKTTTTLSLTNTALLPLSRIVNKVTVNEDVSEKLIRDLRKQIEELRAQLGAGGPSAEGGPESAEAQAARAALQEQIENLEREKCVLL